MIIKQIDGKELDTDKLPDLAAFANEQAEIFRQKMFDYGISFYLVLAPPKASSMIYYAFGAKNDDATTRTHIFNRIILTNANTIAEMTKTRIVALPQEKLTPDLEPYLIDNFKWSGPNKESN